VSQIGSLTVPYTFEKHVHSGLAASNAGPCYIKNIGPYPVWLYVVQNGATVPCPTPTFPGYDSSIMVNVGEIVQMSLDNNFTANTDCVWAHALDQTTTNLKIWGDV
jgi:hypothetical protein